MSMRNSGTQLQADKVVLWSLCLQATQLHPAVLNHAHIPKRKGEEHQWERGKGQREPSLEATAPRGRKSHDQLLQRPPQGTARQRGPRSALPGAPGAFARPPSVGSATLVPSSSGSPHRGKAPQHRRLGITPEGALGTGPWAVANASHHLHVASRKGGLKCKVCCLPVAPICASCC